jgi:hypothetical protein
MSEIDDSSNVQEAVGTCCFCAGDCNPMSQSCGRCARNMTTWLFGIPKDNVIWKPYFLSADGKYTCDDFRKMVYALKVWCASIDEDPIAGDMDVLLVQSGAVRY